MLYPKEIQCPICKKKRLVDFRIVWAIKHSKRKTTARCFKCSRFKKGQTNSGGFKKGVIPWNKGTGKASHWERIKKSQKWKDTRKQVFERDNYTCQNCGIRGGILHPDHIKPKARFPKLVFKLNNIRTLCPECHKKTDTYGYKSSKNKYNG